MKLLIVTVVSDYEKDIVKMFKTAEIPHFSNTDIEGYKMQAAKANAPAWFPSENGGVASTMFLSFTEEDKIDKLFALIKTYNGQLKSQNPVRAIKLPIEDYI